MVIIGIKTGESRQHTWGYTLQTMAGQIIQLFKTLAVNHCVNATTQLLLWLGLIRPFKRKGKLSDPVNQMHIILYKIWQSGGLIYIHKTGQVWTIAVNRFMKRITWIKDEPERMIQVYSERKDGKQSNTHKECQKKWRFVSVCLSGLCCSRNSWKSFAQHAREVHDQKSFNTCKFCLLLRISELHLWRFVNSLLASVKVCVCVDGWAYLCLWLHVTVSYQPAVIINTAKHFPLVKKSAWELFSYTRCVEMLLKFLLWWTEREMCEYLIYKDIIL